MHQAQERLRAKVIQVAGRTVTERGEVSPVDVLVGLGWLQQAKLLDWRAGRVHYLEAVVVANLNRISKATRYFRMWARDSHLEPSERDYKHRSRRLRFSKSGTESIERAYRTHWVLPARGRRDSRPERPAGAPRGPSTPE